jgi:inner membrane protein
MRGHTHALFGLTTLAAANALTGLVQPHVAAGMPTGPFLCAGAAILGALAPDLDADEASIHYEMGALSDTVRVGLHLFVEHRGVLHSGLATLIVLILGVMVGWWLGYLDAGLAFGLGYLSHVALADAMTVHGVPLFWPSSRRFHLLPAPIRVRTGGPAEALVFLLVSLGLIWLGPNLVPVEFLKRWL